MTLTTSGKNAALDDLASNDLKYLAFYTADPGTSATANEVSGGGYARQALAWNSASAGAMDLSNAPIVTNVPASTTVAFVGICTALTGGTLMWKKDVTDEVFGGAGTLTYDDIDVNLNK